MASSPPTESQAQRVRWGFLLQPAWRLNLESFVVARGAATRHAAVAQRGLRELALSGGTGQYAYDALLQRFFNGHARVAELKELLKAKDEKEWKKNMLERSMEHIFDPPQIRELKAQIRSDLCRVINAMSPYEVLMNAPFHETPATSDLLDCDLKYDADTLEHFSSPFGYEGPECSFTSLF